MIREVVGSTISRVDRSWAALLTAGDDSGSTTATEKEEPQKVKTTDISASKQIVFAKI